MRVFLWITVCLLVASHAPARDLEILSHRGVHQALRRDKPIARDACTAGMIHRTDHGFLENTIPSMKAAFEHGATAVELDVHSTSDGQVVVFHDWTLECRTNGRGVTQEQTLKYLRSLDIGHGYTLDGKTFPFRGKGDRMPTLKEVLEAFPHKRLVLDMKSGSATTLDAVIKVLKNYPKNRIAFFCNKDAINQRMRKELPWVYVPKLNRQGIKRCLLGFYTRGRLPDECGQAELMIPASLFRILGKKTGALLAEVHRVGSKLHIWGVDDADTAGYVRGFAIDGVVTDRIEIVGKLLSGK